MTSDFKPEVEMWSKLHIRCGKIAIIGKKQRWMAKISLSYRKSVWLNPFPVTTGSRINAFTCACGDIIAPKAIENGCQAPEITMSIYEDGCAEFK